MAESMMASTDTETSGAELPEVDERLVAPGTRYEIEDGRVIYVPPAEEPQAKCHANLNSLVLAHRADGYSVAMNMLTRTSRLDDFAPHVSVYPTARNPRTGGRLIEELAFLIASSESFERAGRRAAKLGSRGVRRVFAIDVEGGKVLEWSRERGWWRLLDPHAQIEDPALALPLPADAVFDEDRVDDAIYRAWRKRRPELFPERDGRG
jgi:hypothetical protein